MSKYQTMAFVTHPVMMFGICNLDN